VVDARDAVHAEEQYEILTTVVRDDLVMDQALGEKEISQGDSHEYDVKIVEDGGDLNLDTDIGKEGGGGGSAWVIVLVILALGAVAGVALVRLRRRASP
jgi:hypothetical protein